MATVLARALPADAASRAATEARIEQMWPGSVVTVHAEPKPEENAAPQI